MPALVFDLGGTHLRCGVAVAGVVQGATRHRVDTFLSGLHPREIADRLLGQMLAFEASVAGSLQASDPIVFAFPGPVVAKRHILNAPTLYGPSCQDLPDLAGDLQQRTGRKVDVLNDVSAAAWALSARTSAKRFMVVTVSSGIGSKLFDRSHPDGVLDDPPFAGEIGHYVVDPSPDALRCDCGGLGHLGAIASGRGVERTARRMRQDDSLTNEKDIVPAIRRGEPWTEALLNVTTTPLATTLLAVTMAMGLDRVFVIGGFAQSIGPRYRDFLNARVAALSRYELVEGHVSGLIELVGPDEENCLNGAARYAFVKGLGQ